jgi:hypothetical protein
MAYVGSVSTNVKTGAIFWLSGSNEKNRRDERWDHIGQMDEMVAKENEAPLNYSAPLLSLT